MTAWNVDHAIAATAAGQAGWFSAAQAEELDATKGMISRRLESGMWVARHPGVYKVRAYPDSFVGDLWAAHLAAGPESYVSHEAAASLHRLTGFPLTRVVLTVPHPGHCRVHGAVVHQLTDTALHDFEAMHGLRVTTVAWTLVDLAAHVSKARLDAALDDALAARLTTVTEAARCLGLIARPRKPGVVKLAKLLNKHGPGRPIPESKTERLLFDGLAARGEPLPIPQYAHPGRHPVRGCTDGCYPDAKLIVEGDGRRWHARITDMKRDRARDNEASRAGYDTLRFPHEDIVNDIDDVVATIRETRLLRLGLLSARSGAVTRQ